MLFLGACTKVIAKREKSEEGATKEEEAGPVISLVNNRRRGARKRPSPEVDEESEKKDNLKENVTDEKKQKCWSCYAYLYFPF